MKIYIAGGFLEKDLISSFMRRLEAAGATITCDWTATEVSEVGDAKTSDADLTHEEQVRFARADLSGIENADVVWHIVASYKGSRGAYVEVGYAMGLMKTVVVSGPDWRKSIFHALCAHRHSTHEAAFDFLVETMVRIRSGDLVL